MAAEVRLETKFGGMLFKAQGLGVASFMAARKKSLTKCHFRNSTVEQHSEYATLSICLYCASE